ncbi:MAG: DUF2807 domain-containing protein [Candidatus Aminicenantes bacterium]|nr:DUF2807 domain-containing protein [Candidatus Aminicenantes bacterium]MDH5385564.1 DUF2807 domain-containing protein [Candidatus Aminicenantes bacterium]MDH5742907.1 DUF2807 domain-containing protein [Candidatus Aminicenantes bacterium]
MKRKNVWTLEVLLLVLGLLFILSSCSNMGDDSVWGSGPVISEKRDVAFFHSIEIQGSCHVIFVKDVHQELIVEAEQNILPLINTWVKHDGTLIIDSERSYKSKKGVKVYASMLEIRRFAIIGAGEIASKQPFSCDELFLKIDGAGKMDMHVKAKNVYTRINGSGDILLSGSADFHSIEIIGAGNLDALDFVTSVYEITIAGAGYCHIYVTDKLDVILAGAGIVYYKGNPEVINAQISGAGKLVKI